MKEYDEDERVKANGDPFCCISGLSACVVSFTFRTMNLVSEQTNCEEISELWTKASMNVDNCIQHVLLRLRILFNPPVIAISVRTCMIM